MKIFARMDWRLVLFGVLAYVAFLVLSFPADRVYQFWKADAGKQQPIALSQISGSIWSGQAGQALINGQRLEGLSWTLQPWALGAGKVALSWGAKLADGFGEGQLAAGLQGELEMGHLKARLPLSEISVRALQALQPKGTLNLNLKHVAWTGQTLSSAEGRLVWNGAGINILQDLEFGDLVLTLENTPDGVKGVLSDGGGPLQAEGVLTLSADGKYTFSGSFAARGGDQALTNALRTLGRPGADGKVKVSQSGTLAALGLGRS